MKTLLNIVMILFCHTIFSQSYTSKVLKSNEWVNKDLSYLRFENDSIIYNLDGKKHMLPYNLNNKTLTLKETFLQGGTVLKEEAINFKIKYLNKEKLVIYPLQDELTLDQESFYKLNYKPFFSKKEFVFFNKNNMYKGVDYEKITFHGSTCFGTCPSFSVEINRDGKVFYEGRIYTKNYTGNFEGILGKKERLKLIKILNRSQLALIAKNWKQNSHVTDQPRYNYIITLKNGDEIEINTNDQHPILDQLSEYLVHIPEKLELQKVKETHVFNKPSLKGFEIVSREED